MKIAPIDVAHKNFSRKLMGFDADEVGDFLRDVADQMEEIVRERNALKEQLREKELAIMEYKSRDETLKATITTATKMSEQIRQDSEREGKLITSDASQKAEMIVKDARDSLKRIYQEISEAKRMRLQFEISMRSLIQAHVAMLDQGQMVAPDPQMPHYASHAQPMVPQQAQMPQSFAQTAPPPQGASNGGARPPQQAAPAPTQGSVQFAHRPTGPGLNVGNVAGNGSGQIVGSGSIVGNHGTSHGGGLGSGLNSGAAKTT